MSVLPGIGLSLVAFVALALLYAQPSQRGLVLVYAPTAQSTERQAALVARAGGHLAAQSPRPGVILAFGDQPGFPTRLKQQGALLVVNARLAFLCGAPAFATLRSAAFNLRDTDSERGNG